MKTETSLRTLRLLTGAVLVSMISSCALPPREAMRIIQRDGLIPYITSDYSSYAGSGAYASTAPLQFNSRVPYVEPRPMSPIPYRTTYHTNRYTQANYNQSPYQPRTVTSHSSYRPNTVHRRSPSTMPAKEKSVVNTERIKPTVTPDIVAEAPQKPAIESLPYGTPVAGRPGMVTSPFAQKQQLVDVTGMAAGDTVKDPYSGKLFRVPPTAQAAATIPKTASESPAADKPAEKPVTSAPEEPKP
jgi:hypothetical protein